MKFNEKQHIAKAQRTEAFCDALDTLDPPYYEWQTVAVFYAALHYLQAYFSAKTRYYPMTHQDRDQGIANDVKLNPIYKHYRELKQLSLTGRYMCWSTNAHDVQSAKGHLVAIRRHIETLLK
jgi:hypothetical protein